MNSFCWPQVPIHSSNSPNLQVNFMKRAAAKMYYLSLSPSQKRASAQMSLPVYHLENSIIKIRRSRWPRGILLFITHGAPKNTNFLGENGNLVHLYFIHAKLIFKRAFYLLSNGKRYVMPSTDRRLELKAKDIDGSDRLTAGCVCQWVKAWICSRSLAGSGVSIPAKGTEVCLFECSEFSGVGLCDGPIPRTEK